MTLTVGSRLGHYQVTTKIGEGGMGEVWQATDTKLNRQVALKILPEAFASDPDRLARFQREAQVLASLNHPGIAAIYGLEDSEDTKALVLELVEGPTLADRIAQGPIPLDEALPIAKQIAEALEAAHEGGVIHRDLKPANIKVKDDGTVKVLDFGLAKTLDTSPQGDPSQSPTLTAAATQMGVIMGTAAYMSPEQARGKPVDRRADIWSFGVVLYEMLTGMRPFQGEDISLTLASVMKSDVDVKTLPPDLPETLRTVLRRCLEKDPLQRIRDVGDVRLAMEGAFEATARGLAHQGAPPELRVWQRPAVIALMILAAALAGLAARGLMAPEAVSAGLVRFAILPPESAPLDGAGLSRDLVISPDGRQVIYESDGGLYVRPIDQLIGAPLRGGESAVSPFFSPDGQWVGFVSGGAILQKVPILGGPPVTLAELPGTPLGLSWGADDQIVFGISAFGNTEMSRGLYRVSGDGGEIERLTTVNSDERDTSHTWPFLIPDRDAVVFVISTDLPLATGQLAVLDLGTEEVTRLGPAGVSPQYVPTGHLVYASADGSVHGVPFDADGLEVTGSPVPLIDSVAIEGSGAAHFSIAADGSLAYVTRTGGPAEQRSLVWVDREGSEELLAAPPRDYVYPRISPDGTRVALDVLPQNERDIWVWNLAAETLSRLTFAAERDEQPVWTPDGQRIFFASERDGQDNIYWRAADGTGTAELVVDGDLGLAANAVTPDGSRMIAYAADGGDLMSATLDGDDPPEVLLGTEFNEWHAALSPDGAWLAFESDATGRSEVYVRPFPDLESGQWLVSTGGGTEPGWSSDGTELFYRAADGMMGVSVQTNPSFTHGTPQVLFEDSYRTFGSGRSYDVAPDGRFLMITGAAQVPGDVRPRITVVLNWTEELKRLVPVD